MPNKIIYAGYPKSGKRISDWFRNFVSEFIKYCSDQGFETEFCCPKKDRFNLFGKTFSFNGNNLLLANPETEKYIVFSTFYNLKAFQHSSNQFFSKNCLGFFSGHFTQSIVDYECPHIKNVTHPWFFRPYKQDEYYPNSYNPTNIKLYWRGLNIPRSRDVAHELSRFNDDLIDVLPNKISQSDYLGSIHNNFLNISLPGIRDMCNRDVEFWQMKIPFIRPKFTSKLMFDIPDDVYFPIDYELKGRHERSGLQPKNVEKLAQDIINKFYELKDNQKLVKEVGENGYEFWKKNLQLDHIVKTSFDLMIEKKLF